MRCLVCKNNLTYVVKDDMRVLRCNKCGKFYVLDGKNLVEYKEKKVVVKKDESKKVGTMRGSGKNSQGL